jgi:hypothetical protein
MIHLSASIQHQIVSTETLHASPPPERQRAYLESASAESLLQDSNFPLILA